MRNIDNRDTPTGRYVESEKNKNKTTHLKKEEEVKRNHLRNNCD